MTTKINSQVRSKIGKDVTNKAYGAFPSGSSNEIINSQIDSSIKGDVKNTFVGAARSRNLSEEGSRPTPVGFFTRIWKALPGLNGALQIWDKIVHLFRN